jgi:hypothetical protein
MLRSFRVANHKSFRDEAELLLLPAYDKSRPVVPVAGIFGANASGKSNLLDALRWLQTAVRESYAQWEPGAGVPRTPFRLDPDASGRSSAYCVELVLDEGRYTYGVAVDDRRVIEEWLYTYPHNRRRVIFERERDKVRLGSTVPDYRARAEQLARQTRNNALLLSVAAHNDLAEVQPVYRWFRSAVAFADAAAVTGSEVRRRLSDGAQRTTVVELIGAADLGIRDLTTRPDRDQIASLWESVIKAVSHMEGSTDLSTETRMLVRRLLASQRQDDPEMQWELLSELSGELLDSPPVTLHFYHGASRVPLRLDEQSAGTRSWIGLVSAALDVISTGGLLVVDEVDASLHPQLTARLVNLFRDAETNPHRAQLLFTTHDPTLLDDAVLARDEIWFVEKEPDSGASRLYPLTDFRPRRLENTVGRYLAGGYGAVPILADYRFRRAVSSGTVDDAAA